MLNTDEVMALAMAVHCLNKVEGVQASYTEYTNTTALGEPIEDFVSIFVTIDGGGVVSHHVGDAPHHAMTVSGLTNMLCDLHNVLIHGRDV